MIKQAVILAAGLGKRMRPLTFFTPKPLLPIKGKPIIDWIVEWLESYGIEKIIVTSYHLWPMMYNHFRGRENVKILIEDKLYGNAYSLRLLNNKLDREFLVVNGDTITNLDLFEFYKFHKKRKSDFTLLVYRNDKKRPGSIVRLNKSFRVIDFIEKPKRVIKEKQFFTNGGVYLIKKKVLKLVKNTQDDISLDLIPNCVKTFRVFGFPLKNYFWYEIGKLKKYFIINRSNFLKDYLLEKC